MQSNLPINWEEEKKSEKEKHVFDNFVELDDGKMEMTTMVMKQDGFKKLYIHFWLFRSVWLNISLLYTTFKMELYETFFSLPYVFTHFLVMRAFSGFCTLFLF